MNGLTAPEKAVDGQAASLGEIFRFSIRALKARFRDHRAEFAVIKRHIVSGDTVCDVGANKGSFLYWLSRWTGKRGRVVAFEPQIDLASRVAKICDACGLRNVTVETKAVFSGSGFRELHIPTRHKPGASLRLPALSADEFTTTAVPVVALDDYFAPGDRVRVLKVDVEGAELEVFVGAARILREHKPLLVFECENRHLKGGSVRDVFAYLKSLGYEGHFVDGRDLRPLSLFDEAIHQRQDGEWFWKRQGYCNNFVFC
ncbi:MAG TPA: FkbM family methyltransferase [Bradyrhizobium sp.]|uniref:FkbM family methyltransferase n=1 Tax=Bradyrhizobium sp. TaxID=376 RepID=UPI002BB7A491|nr:FkbM family methyltransferase [Bradyrhizobium sp.]HLZ01506.1 FkbM family methyltransferase [Bradyrhizobium sp.]